MYIVFQLMRTPARLQSRKEMWEAMASELKSDGLSEAQYVDMLSLTNDAPWNDMLGMAMDTYILLADLNIKLLVAPQGYEYITSDHPVVKYNSMYEKRDSEFSGTGLSSIGLQIFFPISPAVCLIMYDWAIYRVGGKKTTKKLVKIDREDVDSLNRLFLINAYKTVYFSENLSEKYIKQLVRANRDRLSLPRGSAKRVNMIERATGKQDKYVMTSTEQWRVGLVLRSIKEYSAYKSKRHISHIEPRSPKLYALVNTLSGRQFLNKGINIK